jgi:hypothetical protein
MDAMLNIGDTNFSEVPVRKIILCEVSGMCDFRLIRDWLIMNYTKMNRLVINKNKISYAISLSR